MSDIRPTGYNRGFKIGRRYALEMHAKHFGEKFLREVQGIAAGQIACPQQPAANPRLDVVGRHAGRGLLGLRVNGLLGTDQNGQNRVALQRGALQRVNIAPESAAAELNDGAAQ
jgi:hypothetical protein